MGEVTSAHERFNIIMAWYDDDSWLSRAWGPYLSTILITLIITLTLPVVIHWWLYRAGTKTTTPSFLIVGPSNSGKTSLVTCLERGSAAQTHTSQAPLTVKATLPTSVRPSSAKYRSANDFESQAPKSVILRDTPGHGKLRHHALTALSSILSAKALPSSRNILFVVDAADLSAASAGLREAAEYLYDVLLAVQKAYESATTSKSREVNVLIAANKMDLFTALPTEVVKKSLERELSTLGETKAKGISAVGTKGEGLGDAGDDEDEKDVLGGYGEGAFHFAQMQEFDCQVEVLGGNVVGGDGPGVNGWWEWIALQM